MTRLAPCFLLLLSWPAFAGPLPPASLPDLVEKTLPGVVNISSISVVSYGIGWNDFLRGFGIPQERRQASLGSGLIIDKDGLVLTNNHVVEHATEVDITLFDKRSFRAKIIGTDQKMDLALLQIKDLIPQEGEGLVSRARCARGEFHAVPLGDSDVVRIGESVFAVGNPFGLQHTVTLGIISAKNRTIGLGPFDNFLQTDASINPGNSGGPLFNLNGEVVGINAAIRSETGQSGGLGFAIPVNEAKRIIPDLQRYGRVPRPWLGVLAERMTPQLQQYYRLPLSHGVLIYNIVESAPADTAGLQQGDIIVQVDASPVAEPNDVERALARHRPKESSTLKIRRSGKTLEVPVQLDELPKLDNLPRGII
jgi:serine protease Do